jgi:hypothetical protein
VERSARAPKLRKQRRCDDGSLFEYNLTHVAGLRQTSTPGYFAFPQVNALVSPARHWKLFFDPPSTNKTTLSGSGTRINT